MNRRNFLLAAPAFIAAPVLMKVPRRAVEAPAYGARYMDHLVDAAAYRFRVVTPSPGWDLFNQVMKEPGEVLLREQNRVSVRPITFVRQNST